MTSKTADETAAAAHEKSIKSTWVISFFTLISRVLGYARFILTIQLFSSVRWVSDAMIFAFRIPNLFRNLLGEGALSAAFIPIFVKTREQDGKRSASQLASQISSLLALAGGVITVLGIVVCLALARIWASEGREFVLAMRLTAVFIVFMPLACLAALLGGMLQGLRRFTLPASLSIIINLGFLAGFAYVYWWMYNGDVNAVQAEATYYIAFFVLAAGLIEVVVQIPVLFAEGIRIKPSAVFNHPSLKLVAKGFIPTALGLGLVQINAFIDSVIAGSLSIDHHGAMTYLEVGFRFMQLPLGVFGVAIATVSFPEFASAVAAKDNRKLLAHLVRSLRMSAFFLLPASALLIAMANPIVQLTCQRPDLNFDYAAVYRSALVLVLYSAGLLFYSTRQLLVRVYYARGEYTYPVKVAVVMVVLNLILNLTLIHCPDLFRANYPEYFRYWNISASAFPAGLSLNEAGLALATFITAIVDATILFLGVRKRLRPVMVDDRGREIMASLWHTLARMAVVSAGLCLLTYWFRNSIPYEPGLWRLLLRTVVPCLLAAGALYIVGSVLPLPEMREFLFVLLRRKAKQPDQHAD